MKPAISQQSGFSLLELLVVSILLGIILSLVGGSIVGNLDSVKIRRASKDVVSALRHTRGQAIVKREQRTLDFNVEKMSYTAVDGKTVVLPEGMEMRLRTATSDIVDNSIGRIRFFPDGSSTGGRITLTAGDREWLVNIGWLTGEVTVESGDS